MKQDRVYIAIFVFFCLGAGLGTTLGPKLFAEIAVYAFSLIQLRFMNRTDDFFRSGDKNRFTAPKQDILLAGEALPSATEMDIQEERFLDQHEPKKAVLRNVSALLYITCFALTFTWGPLIAFLMSFFIIRSIYIGHLLLPMGVNLFICLLTKSYEMSLLLTSLYALSFFFVLGLLSWDSGEFVRFKRPLSFVGVVLIFFGCNYLASEALPLFKSEKKALSADLKPNIQRSRSQLLSMNEKLKSLPKLNTNALQDRILDALSKLDGIEKSLDSTSLDNLNSRMHEFNRATGELQLDYQRRISGAEEKLKSGWKDEDLASEIANTIPSNGKTQELLTSMNLNQVKLKELQDKMFELSEKGIQDPKLMDQLKELNQKSRELKDEFESAGKTTSEQRQKVMNFLQNAKLSERTKQNLKGLGKELSPRENALTTIENNLQGSNQLSAKDLSDALAKLPPSSLVSDTPKVSVQKLPELDKDTDYSKLKKILTFLCLVCGLFLFSRFFKKGIKKVSVDDQELLLEIQADWKKTKSLKLSPKEEVITYYNLLHDSLQKISYVGHETPPSCIVCEDMTSSKNELALSSKLLTDIYARCFYGDKEVDAKNLNQFRKSLKQISAFYSLSY